MSAQGRDKGKTKMYDLSGVDNSDIWGVEDVLVVNATLVLSRLGQVGTEYGPYGFVKLTETDWIMSLASATTI